MAKKKKERILTLQERKDAIMAGKTITMPLYDDRDFIVAPRGTIFGDSSNQNNCINLKKMD